jgi:hypothetical protein
LPPGFQSLTLPVDVEPDDRFTVGVETTDTGAGCVVIVTGAAIGVGAGPGAAFESLLFDELCEGEGVGAGIETAAGGVMVTVIGAIGFVAIGCEPDELGAGVLDVVLVAGVVVVGVVVVG